MDTLRLTERGDVATIELVGPRIDVRFLGEFQAICHHLEDASDARVVVLRGAGEDFCRGIDLSAFDRSKPLDIHGFAKWEKMVVLLERLPKATVAALHGRVEGAGVQLALACDARIATADAVLRLPEVHQGFLPGMSVFRVAKYVGLGRAKRLVLGCEAVSASAAVELGLLDEVVDDLDRGVQRAIERFGPVHGVAIEMARRLLNESFHDSYEDAIGHFLAAQHRCIDQPAFRDTLERAPEGE